jgi:hypothetical protein
MKTEEDESCGAGTERGTGVGASFCSSRAHRNGVCGPLDRVEHSDLLQAYLRGLIWSCYDHQTCLQDSAAMSNEACVLK